MPRLRCPGGRCDVGIFKKTDFQKMGRANFGVPKDSHSSLKPKTIRFDKLEKRVTRRSYVGLLFFTAFLYAMKFMHECVQRDPEYSALKNC